MNDSLVFCFPSIVIINQRHNHSLSSPVVATLVLSGTIITIAVTPGL